MNATTEAAVRKHGERLQAIFPQTRTLDPVALCKKLRRLEREGAALGLRLCNGPQMKEGEDDAVEARIIARADALLGYRAAGVPVFLNRDPRGYALKIDEKYMRDGEVLLHRDWGGYGIIAPDLTED